jgi:hypothetical protein
MSKQATAVVKPPIDGLPRLHIFLQKARAFIKYVPVEKGSDWEKHKKCALQDIESLIAMMTPVIDGYDPCQNQRIRRYVKKAIVKIEKFQPAPEK